MRVKILITSVIIVFLFSSCTKTHKTNWERDGLKGKVKSYSEILYNDVAVDSAGNIKGKKFYIRKNVYDKKGNIRDEIVLSANGKYNRRYKSNKYDKRNCSLEMECYNKDTLFSVQKFKYDENGCRISTHEYNLDGTLKYYQTYKNDKNGNQVQLNSFDKNDHLVSKTEFKYDKKENLIEEVVYLKKDDFYKTTYEYDTKGNVVKVKRYVKNDSLNVDMEIISKYEFDKKGNWLKKVDYKNDNPFFMTKREYEYYE